MRLKNLTTYLASSILNKTMITSSWELVRPITNIEGNVVTQFFVTTSSNNIGGHPYRFLSLGSSEVDLCIGSGVTPVTQDDYKLENEIETTNIALTDTRVNGVSNEKSYLIITKHITNNSENDIVVNEIGLKMGYMKSATTTGKVLLAREVLQEPETIMSGETKAFSMTIEI